MKLIYNPSKDPWWHGLRVECPACGKTERMEPGDDKDSRVLIGTGYVQIYCDNCGASHAYKETEARHD